MKYIDAEKLKAEIERRLKDYWKICFHDVKAYNEDSNVRELKELLSFLRTLEEPVTDCHDLAEAKEEYLCKARRTPGHEWMTRDIEDAFKAGAEWQKKQIPMPEDTVIFQKGVEEGKRLMMEGAVEGFIFQSEDYYPKQLIAGYYGELGMGDKVKIIIVKEK